MSGRGRRGPRLLPILLAALGPAVPVAGQAIPPPRDGDIRAVYWALNDLTDVWLTLEPRSPSGQPLPVGLTLHAVFPGRRPPGPLAEVELRAHVNLLWAPRPELSLVIDGDFVDLGGPGVRAFYAHEGGLTGVEATVPLAMLDRMARARSVRGNVLRLEFELTPSQKRAVAAYGERLRSEDPARLPDPIAPVRPVR